MEYYGNSCTNNNISIEQKEVGDNKSDDARNREVEPGTGAGVKREGHQARDRPGKREEEKCKDNFPEVDCQSADFARGFFKKDGGKRPAHGCSKGCKSTEFIHGAMIIAGTQDLFYRTASYLTTLIIRRTVIARRVQSWQS